MPKNDVQQTLEGKVLSAKKNLAKYPGVAQQLGDESYLRLQARHAGLYP